MASISIPGASGAQPLVFTVTGTSTTNYAVAFENAVNNLFNNQTLDINILSRGDAQTAGSNVLNEIFSNSTTSSYSLSNGGQYTLALVGSATTISGSTAGGDTVVAGGDVTYIDMAGSQAGALPDDGGTPAGSAITFIAGDNTFFGSSFSGDTVTGGSGHDSIYTGTGATTVFSGSGDNLIFLGDTATGAGQGDLAYLGDGVSTVNAGAGNDTVVTGTDNQTIFGGSGTLMVNITEASNTAGGGSAAGNVVVAGSGTTNIFDSVGGNSFFGGAGTMTFVGEGNTSGAADSIVAGSGMTAIFGNIGANVEFSSTSGSGSIVVTAGTGNETLNGANAGDFNFFADTVSTDSATNLSVVGGSGTDYFSTGIGNESFHAGTGTDIFGLNTVGGGGANIGIYGFNTANDYAQVNSGDITSQGATDDGNYQITLSDDTTVTFYGVTSLNGHIT